MNRTKVQEEEYGEEMKVTTAKSELLHLVRQADDPEQARVTALQVVISFLALHESFPAPYAAAPPGQD